jgi:arylsulfatase A-like enzyme
VLFPSSTKGLHPDEYTLADHFKSQGYATACYGKWHLGHHPETLPRQNGFDHYFGIPYSNDMNHPDNKGKPRGGPDGMDILWNDPESTLTKWKTPLIENEKIVELPVDQRTITRRCTDKTISFIKKNKDNPFFVYVPHSMPHIPLYVPDEIRDPNPLNAYTCVIEHIDAEVGRIIKTIKELKLDQKTIVIYTTDNGPWLPFKHHGGSAGPLREGKGTTFEGGQRVPCVMWGPSRIPANTVCDELMGTIDLLPSLAAITKRKIPSQKKIDGLDASNLILGTGSTPRKEFLHYTSRGELEGIRSGEWKLLRKKPRNKKQAEMVMLFNLSKDLSEENNLAQEQPAIVARLSSRMQKLDGEIEKNARQPWYKE